MASILETDRLALCELRADDAQFILELLSDPSFLRHIGDKNVRTIDGARDYIANGPVDSYARHGFGLYLVKLKNDEGTPIGICGLVKRDALEDVDIGYAFLPEFRKQGYAVEAAAATLEYGRTVLGLVRIVAVTSSDNEASARLLDRLGMKFERMVNLSEDGDECRLFATGGEC